MQTWARRGIQTALVTGGVLMLGTGIASADEDVNPDKPASPVDLQDAIGKVPVANQVVDQIAGVTVLDNRGDGPVVASGTGQLDLGWVAPVRVDGGAVTLPATETPASQYGVSAQLLVPADVTDVGQVPARLATAGDELVASGDSIEHALNNAPLVAAGQDPNLGKIVMSGDLDELPVDPATWPFGDVTAGVGGQSVSVGEWSSMSGNTATVPVGVKVPVKVPVYDVPANVLAQAITRYATDEQVDVAEGSHINLPTNHIEAVPNQLPSLLPLHRVLARDEQPPTSQQLNNIAGVVSGVLGNLVDAVADQPTKRNLPAINPGVTNPFGPLRGDLFRDVPIVGDLLTAITQLAKPQTPATGLASLVPLNSATGQTSLVPLNSGSTGQRDGLPPLVSQALPASVPSVVPSVLNKVPTDLEVTQIVPTVPSLAEQLRPTVARALPVLSSFPAVDPGTLSDTRAALASLFTNHPIG
ncbi:hypothetical protein [Actinophytocola sediminis]